MGLACNAPYFSGGLHFEKHVRAEEGKLQIYFVPARSKIRLALKLFLGRLGMPLADGKMTKLSVPHMTVETDVPVWPQADGEPPATEGVRHFEFQRLPKSFRLWIPQEKTH
jgi:diacylglycerol kinase family enzyme